MGGGGVRRASAEGAWGGMGGGEGGGGWRAGYLHMQVLTLKTPAAVSSGQREETS